MIKKLLMSFFVILGLAGLFPLNTTSQSSLTIDNLFVELWPEYDRPSVLVIYNVQLSADTPLPAEVIIPLPTYVNSLFVVAYEREGVLVEADTSDFSLVQINNQQSLRLMTPSRNFQFEYYDDTILERQAQNRTVLYEFVSPYQVSQATFEVQEPTDTNSFSSQPPLTDQFEGRDGLIYHSLPRSNLIAGDTFNLSVNYQRSSDELSLVEIQSNLPAPALEPVTESAASSNLSNNETIGYVLIGVGALLLIGTIGSWWWSSRQQPTGRTSSEVREIQQPNANELARFCYQCGTEFRGDARFCHKCGTERRQVN